MDKNDEGKIIEGHEYDGIQELDNHLPDWWLWTFFLTIIFGFMYWIHYSVSDSGQTLDEALNAKLAVIEELKKKAEELPAASAEDTEALLMAEGKKVYQNYCAACHGNAGEGTVGPNLTDKYWIHGTGDEAMIVKVVKEGLLEKGMPAWGTMLKPKQVKGVTMFVISLKGTNPPNGKAPQGNPVE